jgi:protein TonB
VQVSSINVSDSALNSLATTNTALPQLAPSSVRVSQGVSQGLLLKKVPPAYPPMALQLHKEGIVELLTTINKQGLITNIKVLSGDTMLAKPAVDAVRQWKYRPYLLNGEPVEIQTQITINFKAPR